MNNIVSQVDQAVENFFTSTLEISSKKRKSERLEDIYATLITIPQGDKEHRFYLCMGEAMLERLSSQLLCEDNPDQDTLIDLLNESANLIIGNAKVLWEASDPSVELKLTTPEYQGFFEKSFSKEFDETCFFEANNESIMIGIESITSAETV